MLPGERGPQQFADRQTPHVTKLRHPLPSFENLDTRRPPRARKEYLAGTWVPRLTLARRSLRNGLVPATEQRALLLLRDWRRAWAVGRLLAREGCSINATSSEMDGLTLLSRCAFDLVIAEVGSEGCFGLCLLRCARQHADQALRIGLASREQLAVIRGAQDDRTLLLLDLRDETPLLRHLARYRKECEERGLPLVTPSLLEALAIAVTSSSGGEVVVRHGGEVGRVFVVEGRVAWCVAPGQGYVSDDLVKYGIPVRTLRKILDQCQQDRTNFAEALIRRRLIGRDPMRAILGRRIRRCLSILLEWADARPFFLPWRRAFSSDLTYGLDEVMGFGRQEPDGTHGGEPAALQSRSAAGARSA